MIGHLLVTPLEVWRPVDVPDGAGGRTRTWQQVGAIRASVSQPTTRERMLAAQAGSDHDHTVYTQPTADVRRGDELRTGEGPDRYRVIAVSFPSRRRYRRCETQLTQHEGSP
ncbi:phage head closure protein [Streptomyces bohaiensis]|uniref:phage head closure protein n=1 Tax=Streptomyces bohaiensis TaxID=1431344 RepID=UPI003B796480